MKSELIELVKQLRYDIDKGRDYLSQIPMDIRSSIFDNKYTSILDRSASLMRKIVFGKDTCTIEWFLYDWVPGNTEPQMWVSGTPYIFETAEQFYKYLENA
jgi:hypothetical protein